MTLDQSRALLFGTMVVVLFAAGWLCRTLWSAWVAYQEELTEGHRRVEDD